MEGRGWIGRHGFWPLALLWLPARIAAQAAVRRLDSGRHDRRAGLDRVEDLTGDGAGPAAEQGAFAWRRVFKRTRR